MISAERNDAQGPRSQSLGDGGRRSGATKQELTGTALQDFLFRKMGLSWDDVECAGATLADVDERAVRYFLRHSVKSGRMPSDAADLTLRELLEGLGLLSASGALKNAAVLLFGKNPQRFFPAAQFKIGRFGHDETDLLFQDVVEGNLLQMADHVVEVLKSKYLRSPISYEGLVRLERLELPEAAFREVLFNAIVHRNYAGAAIQMKVWDDRVEVCSIAPGSLRRGDAVLRRLRMALRRRGFPRRRSRSSVVACLSP